jgi:hypothetical protein
MDHDTALDVAAPRPATRQARAVLAASLCAAVGAACASHVAMAPGAGDRLRSAGPTPVVYVSAPAPYAECSPGDPDRLFTYGSAGSVYPWDEFRAAVTAPLRAHPPDDPARATRQALLDWFTARDRSPPLRDGGAPVESAGASDLQRRFGPVPVLVLETTRFVLLGCYYAYHPWFNVRATLVDARDGTVLWRDGCGRRYPRDRRSGASPSDLLAAGEALYARMIEARAGECAAELVSAMRPVP